MPWKSGSPQAVRNCWVAAVASAFALGRAPPFCAHPTSAPGPKAIVTEALIASASFPLFMPPSCAAAARHRSPAKSTRRRSAGSATNLFERGADGVWDWNWRVRRPPDEHVDEITLGARVAFAGTEQPDFVAAR